MQIYDLIIDKQQRETTKHGTFEFPVAVYENQINKNLLGYINWHWHDELQFCYVTKGIACICLNQRDFELQQGQGLFINTDILHMAKEIGNTDASYICIDVNPRFLSSFSGSIIERKYVSPVLQDPGLEALPLSPEISWQQAVLEELKQIDESYKGQEYAFELELQISLAKIWKSIVVHAVGRETQKSHSSQTDQQRLREIITYIKGHYGEKISLADLASCVHLSTGECCRFFKRNMNCTLFQYLLDYRLGKSMGLLRDSDFSVSHIAYETGFGSSSYFIEKFRQKTGMTPAAYRKASNS